MIVVLTPPRQGAMIKHLEAMPNVPDASQMKTNIEELRR
jgi:hypothetical protein